ncbi:MAG: hypothetical protein NTV94_18975 [Planctomycetota bacterium]|nr:hypothetical protein [Planctomycetota bacterium]
MITSRTHSTLLLIAASGLLSTSSLAQDLLYSNGPFITNPTGGTGTIAGLPISNADGFTVPGSPFNFATNGVNTALAPNTSIAEDFVVPEGGWKLESLTVYAFQTSQTSPTITTIHVNLWTAPPYSANSPGPLPSPLPEPLLATSLALPAGPGSFICHRQGITSTSTVRPVFAYTVPLRSLPNGGRLAPGTYWIQWSCEGALAPSANVFTPLVSPRTSVANHNTRLFNSIDGSAAGPRSWFEGREGFVAGQADGRAYAVPFLLKGTVLPPPGCPSDINQDGGVDGSDIDSFFNFWESGAPEGDFNLDGGIDGSDVEAFFFAWESGC